jgi:hypothetical protein
MKVDLFSYAGNQKIQSDTKKAIAGIPTRPASRNGKLATKFVASSYRNPNSNSKLEREIGVKIAIQNSDGNRSAKIFNVGIC